MSPIVQTTEMPDRQMLSITRHVYIGELHDHLRGAYEQLAQLIAEAGVERDGKPVAIYHGHVNEEHNGPVEVGIPVKTVPAVDGEVQRMCCAAARSPTWLTLRQISLKYLDTMTRSTNGSKRTATRSLPRARST